MACLSLVGMAHADGGDSGVRIPDPTVNYISLYYQWGSEWGGVLDAFWGGRIFLDPASSQPKGFLSRIYDGNPGNLEDITGSFLIFDGPQAKIHMAVPGWRKVGSIGFNALEAASKTQAKASLLYRHADGGQQSILLSRKILGRRGSLALVAYRSRPTRLGLASGEFILSYANPDVASAFISEIVIDGMGAAYSTGKKAILLDKKCPEGERRGMPGMMKCLRGDLKSTRYQNLPNPVYWERFVEGGRLPNEVHSLLLHVNNTGLRHVDLAPAWLAYPTGWKGGKLPLVLAVNGSDSGHSALELLGLSGRPEYALAPALVEAGMAVLVVEAPPKGTKNAALRAAERMKKAVRFVTHDGFAKTAGWNIDADRVGILGYGQGATLAMLAAMSDIKAKVVALAMPPARVNPDFLSWFAPGDERVVMDAVRKEFLQSAATGNTLVLGDIDAMELWARDGGTTPALEIRGITQASLGTVERTYLIHYLAGHLGAQLGKVDAAGIIELPRRPSEMRPFLERDMARRLEFMDSWYGK